MQENKRKFKTTIEERCIINIIVARKKKSCINFLKLVILKKGYKRGIEYID